MRRVVEVLLLLCGSPVRGHSVSRIFNDSVARYFREQYVAKNVKGETVVCPRQFLCLGSFFAPFLDTITSFVRARSIRNVVLYDGWMIHVRSTDVKRQKRLSKPSMHTDYCNDEISATIQFTAGAHLFIHSRGVHREPETDRYLSQKLVHLSPGEIVVIFDGSAGLSRTALDPSGKASPSRMSAVFFFEVPELKLRPCNESGYLDT